MSLSWRETKNGAISRTRTTSAAPTAHHQRVAADRSPGVYGFATPVDVGPFSTPGCWLGFDLPALAVSGLNLRLFGRAGRSLPWPQRLKRDHDLGGPAAWPLAVGHDSPRSSTVRAFTHCMAALVLPRCRRLLVWSWSIALVDFRSPCAPGSPAWRSVYH